MHPIMIHSQNYYWKINIIESQEQAQVQRNSHNRQEQNYLIKATHLIQ